MDSKWSAVAFAGCRSSQHRQDAIMERGGAFAGVKRGRLGGNSSFEPKYETGSKVGDLQEHCIRPSEYSALQPPTVDSDSPVT